MKTITILFGNLLCTAAYVRKASLMIPTFTHAASGTTMAYFASQVQEFISASQDTPSGHDQACRSGQAIVEAAAFTGMRVQGR